MLWPCCAYRFFTICLHSFLCSQLCCSQNGASWLITEHSKHDFTQNLCKICPFCLEFSSLECPHVCSSVFWVLTKTSLFWKALVKVKVAQSRRTLLPQWTVTSQAPLSMEFSRQEYWSGLLLLLQGIFPTQGSNQGLLHSRRSLYHLSHQEIIALT